MRQGSAREVRDDAWNQIAAASGLGSGQIEVVRGYASANRETMMTSEYLRGLRCSVLRMEVHPCFGTAIGSGLLGRYPPFQSKSLTTKEFAIKQVLLYNRDPLNGVVRPLGTNVLATIVMMGVTIVASDAFAGLECASTASGAIVTDGLVAVVGTPIVGFAMGPQFDVEYGPLICLLDGVAFPLPGDLNGDGIVDGADLGALLGSWGACPHCVADISGDGFVDGADLGILLGNWGAGT